MTLLHLLAASAPLVSIGTFDGSAADLALGPDGYSRFGADPTFVAGYGDAKKDWSYVIPGPGDAWAGGRTHTFGLRFGLAAPSPLRFRAAFVGIHPSNPPVLELRANGKTIARWASPAGKGDGPVLGRPAEGTPVEWNVDLPQDSLRPGENVLEVTSTSGSWAVFDAVEVAGASAQSVPLTPRVETRVVPPGQIELASDKGPLRQIGIRLVNIGPATTATLSVDGSRETIPLPSGATDLVRSVRSGSTARSVTVDVQAKDGRSDVTRMDLKPVRPWQVLVLPGSHVDVGYTHPQAEVAEIQAQNVRDALGHIEATRNRPAAERYRWNSETAWAAEQFLATATPQERRRFETAVLNREIAVSASYLNLLYGLARPEESIRALTLTRRTPGLESAPHDTAVLSDVPGFPWGLATAMREADVKNLVLWPNAGDTMRSRLENRPFWWRTRDGQDKVFVWPMFPYTVGTDLKGTFHMAGTWHPGRPKAIRTSDPTRHFFDEWLPRELAALDDRGYPYQMVGVPWSMGDNGGLDLDLPDAVAAWNRRYANPKLEIATVGVACERFLAKYGPSLPTRSEEFNPQWEDGAMSSARETAVSRVAAERLAQAEVAWTLSGKPFPAARFDAAWRNVLLFSEHTWGADESIRLPDSENTRRQWETKAAFAVDADRQSRALLREALGAAGAAPAFDLVNTSGRARSALVLLDGRRSVVDSKGRPIPSQRLSDGTTALVTDQVPALAARRYRRGTEAPYRRPSASNTIDNGIYRLTVDAKTGSLASLTDLRTGRELVDRRNPVGFAAYGHILGNDPARLASLRDVRVERLDAGPVVWTLAVSGTAPGVRGRANVTFRMARGIDAVEAEVRFDKERVRAKEIAFFSFPFALTRPDLHVQEAWAPFNVATQRFAGANDQFFSVDRWVHLGTKGVGATIVSLDTPIVVQGRPSVARLGRPQPFDPHSPNLHYQLAQNHWHVNYRAEQSGPFVGRFVLRADTGYSPGASARFAEDWTRPLLVAGARAAGPIQTPFDVRGDAEISSLSPLQGDRGWLLRLYGASGRAATISLVPRKGRLKVHASDATGRRGAELTNGIRLEPFSVRTVLVTRTK